MNLEKAIKLAQAVMLVENALNTKYKEWRERNQNSEPVVRVCMDNLHKTMIDYLYGMLGSDVKEAFESSDKKGE